jgi:hypothetical protein
VYSNYNLKSAATTIPELSQHERPLFNHDLLSLTLLRYRTLFLSPTGFEYYNFAVQRYLWLSNYKELKSVPTVLTF